MLRSCLWHIDQATQLLPVNFYYDLVMLHLLSEVWAHILSYVSQHSDLKNLRLVCPRFRDLAAVPLFHTVLIALYPKYFKRLNAIASHAYLSSCVRAVQFDGDLLEEAYLDYWCWYDNLAFDLYEVVSRDVERAMWREAYKLRDQILLSYDPYEQLEYLKHDLPFQKRMENNHRSFARAVSGQKRLLDRPLRTSTLLSAITKFNRLSSVIFNMRNRRPSTVRYEGKKWLPSALRATTRFWIEEADHDIYLDKFFDFDDPVLLKPFVFWLESLADIPLLRDFSCHEIPWNFWYRARNTHDWSAIDTTITNILCNVRSLSLTVSFGYSGNFRRGTALWRLLSFVQAPTQLQKLYLDFQRYEGEHQEAKPPSEWVVYRPNQHREHWFKDLVNISPLIEQLKLSNIRAFHLSPCEFSQAAFIHFMRNHNTTLKEICLEAIQLPQVGKSTDTWRTAIWNIAGVMALERARLDWLQDKYIEAGENWMLRSRNDVMLCVSNSVFFLT